jgi:hypothetical protein
MTKRNDSLPVPAAQLEAVAAYYDEHDTSAEMERGSWVGPLSMKPTVKAPSHRTSGQRES